MEGVPMNEISERFLSSWETVTFVALSTVAIYLSSLVAIRVAGRRTVSQMSAFDFIITVAIGTLVTTTALSRTTTYVDGMTALVTLLLMQVALGALRQKSRAIERVADFGPVVVYDGRTLNLPRSPFGPQMTEKELMSKLRRVGVFELGPRTIVLLEQDGAVSVATREEGDASLVNAATGRG